MTRDSLSPLRRQGRYAVRFALMIAAAATMACSDDQSLPMGPDPIPPAEPTPAFAEAIPNHWTTRARMPSARGGMVAVTVDGIIYVIGGGNADGYTIRRVDAYNPKTTTLVPWTPRAPLPVGRTGSSGAVINGKIYVVGGSNSQGEGTRNLFVYDVAGNSWAAKAQMPVASSGGIAAAMGGKLYVLTTLPGEDGLFTGPSRLFRYDPAANTWVELAPAPNHHHHGVGRVIDGKLYVVGGVTFYPDSPPEPQPQGQLDVYNPATNTWITKASMPTPRWGTVSGVLDGRLYVAGGWTTDHVPVGTLEFYNPASNAWGTRVDMLTPRAWAAGATAGGRLYAMGGTTDSEDVVRTNEAYNP